MIASTASLSCSERAPAPPRLAIYVTHTRSEILEASQLQLFHGTFRPAEHLRDVADPSLFGETHDDHPALIVGQPINQPEEPHALLDLLEARLVGVVGPRQRALTRRALRMINNRVRRNPE